MAENRENKMPFSGLFERLDKISTKKVAIPVTILFAVLATTLICFHEPWLDEAQAWLIARDASLSDMFLYLSHVEGHPSFWWLLLAVPARAGIPYEIGLKGINILIAVAACALFEFRSPFPNAFKIFFPFTYFFFYQYSIVTRPYMLLILALFLAAATFSGRDDKPVFHLLSLILLCLSDTFGIAIAGGIALGWTVAVIKRLVKKDRESSFKPLKHIICLSVLLLTALFLIWTILPSKDATAAGSIEPFSMMKSFLSEVFILPSDICISSFTSYGLLSSMTFTPLQTVLAVLVSIIIWAFFFKAVLKKGIMPDILLPLLTFLLLGSLYIYSHHFGLLLMLGIYCAWISFENPVKKSFNPVICWSGKALCVVSIFIGIIWTGFASMNDILYPYWISRDLYGWIEENKLEEKSWFACWDVEFEAESDQISYQNTAVTREAVPVNPYVRSRKILNFNNEGHSYALFRGNTDEQNLKDIDEWKKESEPDLILCKDIKEAQALMKILSYGSSYEIVYVKESRYSWKSDFTKGGVIVLARSESNLNITPDVNDYASLIGQEG